VGALHLVEHGEAAPVGASDGLPVLIEVEAIRVAAALREHLESLRLGMVAPDALLKFDNIMRVYGVLDLAGARAAGGAIQPAVRAPLKRVGERVRVVHAEAGEEHFGVAV